MQVFEMKMVAPLGLMRLQWGSMSDNGISCLNDLPEVFQEEAQKILENLPKETSCVATGSIVEGFGNPHSDIDMYIITAAQVPGQVTAMGIRKSRYVDCEYMRILAIEKLCQRINGSTWNDLEHISLREIDRYYRIAIGIPIRVSDDAAAMLGRFSKAVGCAVFSRFALLQAYQHLGEAAYAVAARVPAAGLLLRESALWHATYRLAVEGEGYPSVKWTGEKAARRYRRGSPAFQEMVADYMRPAGSPGEQLTALRSAITLPTDLQAMLDGRSCRLAEEIEFIDGPGDSYLVAQRSCVSRVSGPVARTCRRLAAGDTWFAATAAVADELRLPPGELREAVWRMTADQRRHGFLIRTP
jgi:hypothetical protein